LRTADTSVDLHVFEGEGFEGHVTLLMKIGDQKYPATDVMKKWLDQYAPA
jgi:hypothetical protein